MEEFRKKIQRRLRATIALCLLAPAILTALHIITKRGGDFFSSPIFGAFCGGITVAVFNLARLSSALRDEEKLKKLYIAETDERNIALNKETSGAALLVGIVGICFASLIAYYFSVTVCLTLAAAAGFLGLAAAAARLYYNRKM